MRRKEKEITHRADLESIIMRSQVCRLALSEGDQPYLVPLCFGYKDNALYFHSAREGRKVDILRRNNKVCFELDIDHELVKAEKACEWGMKYRSVIGFGKAFFLDEPQSKRTALDIIMEHYSGKGPFSYAEKGFEKSLIIKIEIEFMTGKKSGY